jgi:hypothetical protein
LIYSFVAFFLISFFSLSFLTELPNLEKEKLACCNAKSLSGCYPITERQKIGEKTEIPGDNRTKNSLAKFGCILDMKVFLKETRILRYGWLTRYLLELIIKKLGDLKFFFPKSGEIGQCFIHEKSIEIIFSGRKLAKFRQ